MVDTAVTDSKLSADPTQHSCCSPSDGWAWYRCNPVKASWRITMSNSKPCNMHYNNKGILETFFNIAHAEEPTGTTPVHFPFSVITFLPSAHHLPALPFSRPVHHCPCDIIWFPSITLSPSFTLFRCYTVSFPFWRHPRVSSVSLQGLHSRRLLCHDDATGDADIFCKWHSLIASSHLVLFVIVYSFYIVSCVHLLRFAWVACFRFYR